MIKLLKNSKKLLKHMKSYQMTNNVNYTIPTAMQSLIHGNFEGAAMKKTYALVGAAAAVGAAVGPLIGGFVTTYLSGSEADYQAMESQQASNNGAVQQASNNKYFTAFVNWSSVTMVDAFIAAGGLIFAGVVLRSIDLTMGKGALPLFNGAMLTMAIVFFANPAPPPYKVFLQCTIGAWSLGFLLKYMMLESMIVTIIVTMLFF